MPPGSEEIVRTATAESWMAGLIALLLLFVIAAMVSTFTGLVWWLTRQFKTDGIFREWINANIEGSKALPKLTELQNSISLGVKEHDERTQKACERLEQMAGDLASLRTLGLHACEVGQAVCQKLGCWDEVSDHVSKMREVIARVDNGARK